jgi:hypothetical protein
VVEGDDVRLDWTLAEPLPLLLRWRRGTAFDDAIVVGGGWFDAGERGEVRDVGAAPSLPQTYWLESLERDGSSERWGPWRVERAPSPFMLSLRANPVRGEAVLAWSGTPPADAAIRIHDVRGRLVADVPLPAGVAEWTWSGRDAAGRDLPAGIYFARVTAAPGASVRIVRLP